MIEKPNLEEILSKKEARIYFIGIGGIAMSAVASLAQAEGFEVCGSDSKEIYPPAKDVLNRGKIKYFVGYDVSHVKDAQADLYVISAGEGEDNPEVKYILEKQLPRTGFPEFLAEMAKDKLRVVVAGTHGKSTTAGLLGHILKNLDNSSFMVGAVLQNYGSNFHHGDGHYFVFEGDEYKSEFDDPTPKFQYYKPDILVLTNLEFDHPDVFADLTAMEQEFSHLIANMPEDGLIVYNADDARLSRLVHESNVTSVGFSLENEADFRAEAVSFDRNYTSLEVRNKFSKDTVGAITGKGEEYKIQLPGKINVYNALAVIATLRSLGFGREQVVLDLLSYRGVKRRFEVVGIKNGITIIDDYAHHPTAVKETLEAARLRYPQNRIWAVFEPHTFSRTKATLPDLAKAFGSADEVLISEIYPAREKLSDATISSQDVVQAIGPSASLASRLPLEATLSEVEQVGTTSSDSRDGGLPSGRVRLVRNKQEALDILKSEAGKGDVVIVMAVGSFNRLAYELKEVL